MKGREEREQRQDQDQQDQDQPLLLSGREDGEIGNRISNRVFSFPRETIRQIWACNEPRRKITAWFGLFFQPFHQGEDAHAENLRRFLTETSRALADREPWARPADLEWLMNKLYFRLDILAQDSGIYVEPPKGRELDDLCSASYRAWKAHFGLE